MIAIETVLCPVDFSPATLRQVDVPRNWPHSVPGWCSITTGIRWAPSQASAGWERRSPVRQPGRRGSQNSATASRVPEGVSAEPLMTEGPPRARCWLPAIGEGRSRRPHGARNALRRPCVDHAAGARGRRARGFRAARADSRASHATVRIGSAIRRSSSRYQSRAGVA
jgi:hypothetical protein